MTGNQNGYVCNQTGTSNPGDPLICVNLTIPSCADRNIYCTYPPMKNTTLNSNPNLNFNDPKGKNCLDTASGQDAL